MREGFLRKRCLKCGGNIYLARDEYGWYEQCLQCGCARELSVLTQRRERAPAAAWGKLGEAPK